MWSHHPTFQWKIYQDSTWSSRWGFSETIKKIISIIQGASYMYNTEYIFPYNVIFSHRSQCRQSPCCVNLLTEARRSVRAKENICRTAGPGRETGRLWVYFFMSSLYCAAPLSCGPPHNDTAHCLSFLSREEWLLPMTPPQPYRTGQYLDSD